jgi:putative zinc finger protein
MNNSEKNTKRHAAQTGTLCTAPELGARVPDYIADLLDDAEALVIENHLGECNDCRTSYLTVIGLQHAGRKKRLGANGKSPAAALDPATDEKINDQR